MKTSASGVFEEITEGTTDFLVPSTEHLNGPMARSGNVFYNPAMRGTRDITVLFERVAAKPGWKILDGLSASGAKALRLYEEGKHGCQIIANDHDPRAVDLIQKNIENWGRGGRISATRSDLNALMIGKKFDWVDIDPFGPPVPFLDAGIEAVKSGGILSITATDTAPLSGTYPTACIRRYGSRPLRTGCKHEIGLRILTASVIKRAAALEKAAIPVLSYFSGHYFRAYFRIKKGAKLADGLLKQMCFVVVNEDGGYTTARWPIKGRMHGGPLWSGPLNDKRLVLDMAAEADKSGAISKDTRKLLAILSEELDSPPFNYSTDEVSRKCGIHPPNTKKFVERLRDEGFEACLVHYDPKNFRSDAGWSEISRIAKVF